MVWLPHWPTFSPELKPTLGLDRILSLLEAIGSPHKKLPPVIHVTGTNGKGSVIAFIRAILEASGLSVHRYTSPHLLRFNERILLAGHEISDHYLFSLLEECRMAVEKHGLIVSFFEGTTAAAFLGFSRVNADVLLLEVGLGGRLDATNVIEKPLATVITTISMDHITTLGNTLEKIAYEKACIIKQNSPCIVSLQMPIVKELIRNYTTQMNAPLIMFENDYGASIGQSGELIYKDTDGDMILPAPALPGLHQYVNAAAAIATVKTCYQLNDNAFKLGLVKAHWDARLTQITRGKLFKILKAGTELWVDGAHNEGGAQAVAAWLQDRSKKTTCLIFNMTKNRDVNNFLSKFIGLLDKIVCVNIYSEPLSYRSDVIQSLIQFEGLKAVAVHTETLEEAFKLAADSKCGRILIAGSLFLASDFFLENKN